MSARSGVRAPARRGVEFAEERVGGVTYGMPSPRVWYAREDRPTRRERIRKIRRRVHVPASIVNPQHRARPPRKRGVGVRDQMWRVDVGAATTLPHRRALRVRLRIATDEKSEYWREGRPVAASENRAVRRDDGELNVEARRVDEKISALRSEHGRISDGSSGARGATVRHQQVRSCRDQAGTRGCRQHPRKNTTARLMGRIPAIVNDRPSRARAGLARLAPVASR